MIHNVSQKSVTPHPCPYLYQILTDFKLENFPGNVPVKELLQEA